MVQKQIFVVTMSFPVCVQTRILKKLSQRQTCRRGRDRGCGRGHHDPSSRPAVRIPDQEYKTPFEHTLLFLHSTFDYAPIQKDVTQLTNVCRRRPIAIAKNKRQHKYAPARQVDTPKQLRYISCSVFGDHMSNRCGKITCVMTSYVIVACIVELSRRERCLYCIT